MFSFQRMMINGHSMEPYIHSGERVVINKHSYVNNDPQVGDVIAVMISNTTFVKRIAEINDDKIIVHGDNVVDSLDSRKLGSISRDQILGKVIQTY